MKKILLVVSALCILQTAAAQVTFQKKYSNGQWSDWAKSVAQTTDGGYIISGSVHNVHAIWDARAALFKTDSMGTIIWEKTFSDTSGSDDGISVLQTVDGGYLVACTLGVGATGIIKTNSTGDTLWTKIIAYGTAKEIRATSDGGYIIAGNANGTGPNKMSLIKIDSSGNFLWRKSYGSSLTIGSSAMQTGDGGYIVVGSASFPSDMEVCLVKTDSSGNALWAKTYGYAGYQEGMVVRQTADGGYIVAGGASNGNNYTYGQYLIKTNGSGSLMWSKVIGSVNSGAKSMHLTADGGYIIAGMDSNQKATLLKTDSLGNVQWTKNYGPNSEELSGNIVIQTNDNGYLLAGSAWTPFPSNDGNIYLVKTDSLGNSGCDESVGDTSQIPHTTFSANFPTTTTSGATIIYSPIYLSSGISEVPICPVGIDEVSEKQTAVSLFPNPAANELRIKNAEIRIESVEIYNVLGEKVFSQTTNAREEKINVSSLPPGIYFVKVKSEKEERVAKFVKQ
jgi:hypothetical protein